MTQAALPSRDDLIQVGHVHTAYGIKGWVWVMSRTEPIANIFSYGPWYLDRAGTLAKVVLVDHRAQGKGLVAQFAGCEDRNSADLMIGATIWVPKSALKTQSDNEYFWSDLMGMRVVNEQGVLLGCVDDMMETGANDVIVLKACDGSVDDQERLLPWVNQVVLKVDREAKCITVDWDPEF
jgi:16S rRNA processing protein RimM